MLATILQASVAQPIDLSSWQLVWLCVGMIGGLVIVTFVILARVGRGNELTSVLCDGQPLRMLTVASIVASVLVLALAGRIDSQAVATILSGIAGYVLGSAGKPG